MSKYSMQLSMRLYGVLVLLLIALFQSDQLNFAILREPRGIGIVLVAVFLGMSGLTLTYEVLSKMDVSNFAVTKSFAPVVTVILSFIFLGERLSPFAYIGIVLVVLSLLGMSYIDTGSFGKREGKENLRNILLMILAFALMSSSNILYKTVSSEITPLSYSFILFSINIVIFFAYLYIRERDSIRKVLSFDKDLVLLGVVATLAMFFFVTSFTLTTPTIANTIAQLQVFLIIFLGYIFLKERKGLKMKTLMASISVLGVLLVVNF